MPYNFNDAIECELIKMKVNLVFIFNVVFPSSPRDYSKDLNNPYPYESELQASLKLIRVKTFRVVINLNLGLSFKRQLCSERTVFLYI